MNSLTLSLTDVVADSEWTPFSWCRGPQSSDIPLPSSTPVGGGVDQVGRGVGSRPWVSICVWVGPTPSRGGLGEGGRPDLVSLVWSDGRTCRQVRDLSEVDKGIGSEVYRDPDPPGFGLSGVGRTWGRGVGSGPRPVCLPTPNSAIPQPLLPLEQKDVPRLLCLCVPLFLSVSYRFPWGSLGFRLSTQSGPDPAPLPHPFQPLRRSSLRKGEIPLLKEIFICQSDGPMCLEGRADPTQARVPASSLSPGPPPGPSGPPPPLLHSPPRTSDVFPPCQSRRVIWGESEPPAGPEKTGVILGRLEPTRKDNRLEVGSTTSPGSGRVVVSFRKDRKLTTPAVHGTLLPGPSRGRPVLPSRPRGPRGLEQEQEGRTERNRERFRETQRGAERHREVQRQRDAERGAETGRRRERHRERDRKVQRQKRRDRKLWTLCTSG